MNEFVIDYDLKSTMTNEEFAKYILKGKICELIGKDIKSPTLAHKLTNRELISNDCLPIKLSKFKYYWYRKAVK